MLERVPLRREVRERPLDQPLAVQLGLGKDDVELDAELPQVFVLLRPLRQQGDCAAAAHPLVRRQVGESAPLAREGRLGELDQVLPLIAAFGKLRRASHLLLHPRPQRAGELVDLDPGVVHVELTRHRVAGPLEQRRQRVAQRRPASVAHVQRARRIGRHELDVHLEPPPRVAPPVVPASRKDLVEHPRELRLGEKEVDEPRACDLDLFHVTRWQLERLQQLLGDVPGLAAEQRGEYQGEVCRGVAVRGIARRFDFELRYRGRAELPRRTRERVDQRLMALHLSLAGFFFELSEVLDSGAFDSPVFPSAGLESASFVPGFSPARL